MIVLTGVGREFAGKRNVTALAGVDLRIERGEMTSIVGPCGADLQGLGHISAFKHQVCHLAFAVRRGFHALGQGIGHAHAHAVQTAGEAVRTA